MTSISISAQAGSPATATVLRAGLWERYFQYISFTSHQSDIFFRNTIVFTTFDSESHSDSRIAEIFLRDCSVSLIIHPSTSEFVFGLIPISQAQNNKFQLFIAWEYAQQGIGAFDVSTTFIIKKAQKYIFVLWGHFSRLREILVGKTRSFSSS